MKPVLFRFFRSEERKKMLKTERAHVVTLIVAMAWLVFAPAANFFITGHVFAKDFEPSMEGISLTGLVVTSSIGALGFIVAIAVLVSLINMTDERVFGKVETRKP